MNPYRASLLFIAPECAPLVKTGGLGDVCAALPPALRALGIDARVLMPGYRNVLHGVSSRRVGRARLLGRDVELLEARLEDVPLLVLDCPALYDRPGGPYQDERGADWPDNDERFAVLSRAAALLATGASPLEWRPELVHCNDWQSALVPVYLALESQPARPRTILTIHNLAFQGNFDAGALERAGLPASLHTVEGLEFYGKVSFLKGGLLHADALTTVSPTYAREIQHAGQGCGMEGVLSRRSADLHGILNGIDERVWDPARDPHLAARYAHGDLEGKRANKAALQARMGLDADASVPLFGCVGRMTEQKGTDLIIEAGGELARLGQLAIVGAGSPALQEAARALAARHPGRIAVHVGFSEPLAHLVEAGADLFLMPSRYEPCGLNQMYSQRYGTPPIARATGGLSDTIVEGATGFLFGPASAAALVEAARRALACYADGAAWRRIQLAGMSRDFSWGAAARRYADLYRKLAIPQPA
ncbi:MAG: glycogen synthase GlgA [Betaproteobacteria bacterium]|nr:glycogen synthase GlgA [Betaproteobacteria bacterium]